MALLSTPTKEPSRRLRCKYDVMALIEERDGLYAGTGDGAVRIVAPDGALLGKFSAGGPSRDGCVLTLAPGPAGVLAVTGTDGVLRLYQ